MKSIYLTIFLILWIIFSFAQNNTATLVINDVDISTVSAGDTLDVDVYLEEVTDSNVCVVNFCIKFDTNCIVPTQYFLKNKHDELTEDWMEQILNGNVFTAQCLMCGFAPAVLTNGDLLFTLEFIYTGGSSEVVWHSDSIGNEYYNNYVVDYWYEFMELFLVNGNIGYLQNNTTNSQSGNLIKIENNILVVDELNNNYELISIFNLTGQLVHKEALKSSATIIPLKSSFYIVVLTGKNQTFTSKILVR